MHRSLCSARSALRRATILRSVSVRSGVRAPFFGFYQVCAIHQRHLAAVCTE